MAVNRIEVTVGRDAREGVARLNEWPIIGWVELARNVLLILRNNEELKAGVVRAGDEGIKRTSHCVAVESET